MITFKNYNANPKGKRTADCTIRAISMATDKSYYEVYEDLYQTSLKTGYMLNEKRCEEKVLAKYGFVKHKQPRKANGTKYVIGEICQLTTCNTIVISCAGHLTCVKDMELIDIWDCRHKTICNYYTLDNE